MNDLELIDNYAKGQLSPDEQAHFEAELTSNPATAEALAFYFLTKQVAGQQALADRKAELAALRTRPVPPEARVRPLWGTAMRWVAVAASVVLVLAVGYYALRPKTDTLADLTTVYANEHFSQLPVRMGGEADALQKGIAFFNDGQLARADSLFSALATAQPTRDDALTYAGITAFRLGQYDRAIDRFHQLGLLPGLFANPGPYYEALTHLRRNLPMDKSTAKTLLQQVVKQTLAGSKEAKKLLNTNDL